ncbi:hypothetical protein GCM10022381_13230 [Leifsonia kafniensis]|uniref:TubC N-terminal docking domain-containing protein n=1 Tax=Leifsonia kafniensis TaxID=475957 RepID=A0ABP7KAU2_9MICO
MTMTDQLLTDAIIAYVGKGRVTIPTADENAVREIDLEHADELLSEVRHALADSDRIELARSEAVDGSMWEPFRVRLAEIRPDLDERAADALGWRWGFNYFHG